MGIKVMGHLYSILNSQVRLVTRKTLKTPEATEKESIGGMASKLIRDSRNACQINLDLLMRGKGDIL